MNKYYLSIISFIIMFYIFMMAAIQTEVYAEDYRYDGLYAQIMFSVQQGIGAKIRLWAKLRNLV